MIYRQDLVIQNGDFLVDESDNQHIEHILKAAPGQFRQWPLIGVSAYLMQGASVDRQALVQKIRVQLAADNYIVRSVKVTPGDEMKVEIDAKRKK